MLLLPFAALALARDLLPEYRLEEIPATDGSIQKCLIFETIPGVDYRVEVSDDLAEWSTESETYGMGYEFAIPVREAVPPPPPGPGDVQ